LVAAAIGISGEGEGGGGDPGGQVAAAMNPCRWRGWRLHHHGPW